MRKIAVTLMAVLWATFALAQNPTPPFAVAQVFSAPGTSVGYLVQSATTHTLSWAANTSVAVTGCLVQVDSGPTATGPWTGAGVIASQACNSGGTITVTSTVSSFARVQVTAITTGSVVITYSAINGGTTKNGGGSITSVIAGAGLSGGGNVGAVTLTLTPTCPAPLNCGTPGTIQFLTTYPTGYLPYMTNAGQPTPGPPKAALGNGGAVVNSGGAYTLLCDTTTTLRDRVTFVEFQTGASVSPIVPDSTATGCGGLQVALTNETSPTLTFARTSADTFTVCQGTANCTAAGTSFTLLPGQFGVISQTSATNWLVRLSTGPQPTFGTNGVIGGQWTLAGSTSGSVTAAPSATGSSLLLTSPITMADNAGIIFTQSTSPAGTQGATFAIGGSGTTEVFTFTSGTSTGLIKTNSEQSFSFNTAAFTLAASPITVATWNMPNIVKPWGGECHGQWSNPAGTTPTLAFGDIFTTASPTIAEQHGVIYETNAADGAFSGKQAGTTSVGTAGTNANFVTTGTITNSATLFQFDLYFTFTAAATTTAFAITASLTGTGATGTLAGHCTIN